MIPSGHAERPSTDTLFGVDEDLFDDESRLYVIDLATGLSQSVGAFGISTAVLGLAFDTASGDLFAAGNRGDGGDLLRIDVATGAASVLGAFSPDFIVVESLVFVDAPQMRPGPVAVPLPAGLPLILGAMLGLAGLGPVSRR